MGVFTRLDDDEMREVLARFGVTARAVSGVAAGSVNTWFAVDTANQRLFLRLDERRDPVAVEHELALLRRLAQLPVPRARPTLDGRDYALVRELPALLFDALPGAALEATEFTPARLTALALFMASMHAIECPAKAPAHRFNPGTLLADFYAPLRPYAVAEHPAAARLLDEVFAPGAVALSFAELPQATIHADLFADNLQFQGDALVGVLDFEAAGRGPRLLDLAIAVHGLCFAPDKGRYEVARARALVHRYQDLTPLTDAERDSWRDLLAYAAARFLVTRLRDFERPGRSPEGVWKDYREYVEHLRALDDVSTLLR